MNHRAHAMLRMPITACPARTAHAVLVALGLVSAAIPPVPLHAAPIDAVEPTHELIDNALESHEVRLLGWDSEIVSVIGDDGIRREEPIAEVLAVMRSTPEQRWRRPSPDELAGGTAVVIEMVDGQRFIGSVGPWDSEEIAVRAREAIDRATDTDTLALLSPAENTVDRDALIDAVPLELIARVLFDPWATGLAGEPAEARGVDDELIFTNGDRLSGFLVAIDEAVRFDTGNGDRAFQFDRISRLRLGNPTATTSGPRLWLTTGEIRDGLLPAALTHSEAASASSDAIHAGWFADERPVPLAELPVRETTPGPGRRWAKPPQSGSAWSSPLGLPDLALDGPVSVAYRLPPGASSFSTIAVLGATLSHPEASPGPWANAMLRITVRSAQREIRVAEEHLRIGASRVPIACQLPDAGIPDRVLVIEVLEGAHGPIQDRVLLRRPFLLSR